MSGMQFSDLEIAYERLAEAIDRAGPANEALFLARLVILQAQRGGDLALFLGAVEAALQNLPDRAAINAPAAP